MTIEKLTEILFRIANNKSYPPTYKARKEKMKYLIQQAKTEQCKKQREIVINEQFKIMEKIYKENKKLFDWIAETWNDFNNVGLNAPEPE